jgi:hypothetical protein
MVKDRLMEAFPSVRDVVIHIEPPPEHGGDAGPDRGRSGARGGLGASTVEGVGHVEVWGLEPWRAWDTWRPGGFNRWGVWARRSESDPLAAQKVIHLEA